MARVAIDDFGDDEIARIYLAVRLAEAELVEAALNKHNVEYAVEVEPYLTTTMWMIAEYKGAAFYVVSEDVDLCCRVLRETGLSAGLMKQDQ